MKTLTLLNIFALAIAIHPTQAADHKITAPKNEIVIAIIDTGIDVNHPYIKDNLWVNPHEKLNDLDNDGNGYAGDLHGWNFVSNDNDLTDNHGHGTHIAGIIKQRAQSTKIKFMILKYYDPLSSAKDNLMNSVKAIRYAIKMKADIINYSGGGDEKSLMEEQAILDAQGQGVLFVAAAGNEGRNTDDRGYYPAGYKLNNLISVAATDYQEHLLPTSNFGKSSVHTAAPGKDIYSSLPAGKFGYMTGTSQATAWISGELAKFILDNNLQGSAAYVREKFLEERNTTTASLMVAKAQPLNPN